MKNYHTWRGRCGPLFPSLGTGVLGTGVVGTGVVGQVWEQ